LLHSLWDFLGYLVPFVLVLGVLVFVHELGHYWVARYNGVRVEVFSIGFGPEIFGWADRAGTRWKISWLPLGGYVKMWGDENPASTPDQEALSKMSEQERAQSLHAKSVGQRIAVSAAGPLANYLLALSLFAGLFMIQGQPYVSPIVGTVVDQSPASQAGFQAGDRILSVEGQGIKKFEELAAYVSSRPGQALSFSVQRDEQVLTLEAVPAASSPHTPGKGGFLGLQGADIQVEKVGFFYSFALAFQEVWHISSQTLLGIFQMITGQLSADGMGGPLLIARLAGDVASLGVFALLRFAALLSVNLGLINLLPIPILDGGHIFLYALEGLWGRPLSDRALQWCYKVGMGIVLFVFILTTWNDLKRFALFQSLLGFFS
jgi:regulator of sigma E protease